ncbi:hypothetical protein RAS1_31480 [Phycisphaerae bacterium RAS1]|nr:hypothetical protein RAS1_31480 [Phycisphaerae bacterium RAS1]
MAEDRRLCPNDGCDHVNPAAARFCARCGRPLPAAGAAVPAPDWPPHTPEGDEIAEFAWRLGGFVVVMAALMIGSVVLFRLQGLTNGIWLVLPLIAFGAWLNPWRRRT